jgi:hypothetical protein
LKNTFTNSKDVIAWPIDLAYSLKAAFNVLVNLGTWKLVWTSIDQQILHKTSFLMNKVALYACEAT